MRVKLNLKLEKDYIFYVEDNFNVYYAPTVARLCATALPHLVGKKADQVRQVAVAARACIESWTIRDETDRRDAAAGLAACTACGV